MCHYTADPMSTNQFKSSHLIFQRPAHHLETKLSTLTFPGMFFKFVSNDLATPPGAHFRLQMHPAAQKLVFPQPESLL